LSKTKEITRTTGAVLLAVAFFFLLNKVFSFNMFVSGALAVGMYIGAYFLLKPSSKIGKVEVEKLKGGENSLELMEEAKKDILSMEKNMPLIKDPATAGYVSGLTRTGRKILVYLTEHPDRIADAHRFCDYYLDMAEKLTGIYVQMQKLVPEEAAAGGTFPAGGAAGAAAGGTFPAGGAAGAAARSPFGMEIEESSPQSVMVKTRDALKILNTAFENQLNRLMQGDLMEVESEIEVLRHVIKMEGDS